MSNLKRCAVEGCGKWEFQKGVCKAHIGLAGSVVPSNFCSECGAKLPGDTGFCSGCGAKVKEATVKEPVKEDPRKEYPEPKIDTGLKKPDGGDAMSAAKRERAAHEALVSMGFEGYKPPAELCTRCRETVDVADLVNPHVNASGKYFHAKCFTCRECGIPLQNETSFLVNGDYTCEAHRNAIMCHGCKNPIGQGDKINALGNDYHPTCFICVTCGIVLADQPYYAKDGQPYCKPDYKTKFPGELAPVDLQLYICAGCKDWIKSAAGYTESPEGKFHPVCFETYKVKAENKQLKACSVCNVQLENWVEVNGKFMHPTCWLCVNCKVPLTTEGAVSKKGKFYCTPCHKDPFREF